MIISQVRWVAGLLEVDRLNWAVPQTLTLLHCRISNEVRPWNPFGFVIFEMRGTAFVV